MTEESDVTARAPIGWFVGTGGRFYAIDSDGETREVGPQEALNQLWSGTGPTPKGEPL